jgi:hypothetical protein
MKWALFGAVVGLCIGAHPACSQDIAAVPAYPASDETAGHKPRPKPVAKPIAKPARVKSAATTPAAAKPPPQPKPAAIRLPEARPAIAIATAPMPVARPTDIKPADIKLAARPDIKDEPKSDAAAEPLQDPLASVPAEERAPLRAALLWSAGDDARPAPGEDAVVAAIRAYQKRTKAKVTGTLSDSERADLLAAAKSHDARFGWTVLIDPATGIRMGVPEKLAPQIVEAKNGTRWSSRHGEFQIETFRTTTNENLSALFERQKNQPSLKLESSYLRPDGFFVSGLQGLKQFAVRAQMKDGELRGYTLRYDQAMEGIVLPVLPAIANAFAPFPSGATPIATLSRPVDYGSGVVVTASGYIVTDRRFAEGCAIVTIPGLGDADRIAADEQNGLALLRVYGRHDLKPAELAPDGAAARDLTLIGIADPRTQDGGGKSSEIKAQLGDGNVLRLREPLPVAGFAGAPALDPQGRVLGIVEMRNAMLASAEPAAPPVRLVSAASIRGFLALRNIAVPQSAATNSAEARSAVVRVICVRQ